MTIATSPAPSPPINLARRRDLFSSDIVVNALKQSASRVPIGPGECLGPDALEGVRVGELGLAGLETGRVQVDEGPRDALAHDRP